MNETWLEKIGDYLNGKMNHEERMQFEAEMASNEELYAVFKLYQTIEKEMSERAKHSSQEGELKSSLDELSTRYFPDEHERETGENVTMYPVKGPTPVIPFGVVFGKVKRVRLWKSIAVAASIIGLIILGTIWFRQGDQNKPEIASEHSSSDTSADVSITDSISKSPSIDDQQNKPGVVVEKPEHQQESIQVKPGKNLKEEVHQNRPKAGKLDALFASNFKPDTLPVRKAGPLQTAYQHYESGDYEDAISAFEQVNMDVVTRGNDTNKALAAFYMHYFKGLSYLAINRASTAIQELEKALAGSPDAFSKGKTLWYLSLAYIKSGEPDKALNYLRKLAVEKQAGIYRDQGVKLMGELTRHSLNQAD
ncbi:hypothetical protein OCK74_22800 [Chitinophagaceae bacterium LB-8]|uniref:Tetratricopeptide repeat protein n=1 Tax=Paraflavisolibacter caeni TaxID=2982496 RepID=A0A9X2XZV2_9BACT|nr:hypothetical protein [Paraflavisolibacter caeni]MCU7551967.1 hypothetical protein [Paraflavisolibacter caeni]